MSRAAYAIDGRDATREAFYAAACDPSRSVVVEACAGAGKTWMLVSRILRALLDGAEPHEVLAITFTKKAAGEMRERLDQWLAAFAAPGCSDAERIAELRARGLDAAQAQEAASRLAALHERLLRTGRVVEVRTFHAWFAQLLRAAPLALLAEVGMQRDAELVEDPTVHHAEVYRRFHAAVAADVALRGDFATLVAQRGRMAVRRWLDTAWNRRVEVEQADAAGTLDDSIPAPQGVEGDPAQALLEAPWVGRLRALADRLHRTAGKTLTAGQALAAALGLDDPRARYGAAWAALYTQRGEPRKLSGPAELLGEVQSVQAGLESLGRDVRQHDARVEHLRMARLARVLLAEYAAFKRARGLADMADLERGALLLLRDSALAGWVQERLDGRVRHLLVDEFQDTSPLQWHALHAWLAGYAGAGGGASGQRPPSVFIVGDPKQSIYRFRGAEPRVFDAARHFVVQALGGSVLACDHTRRNAPALVAAVNAVFEHAQAAGDYRGFRPHTTEVPDDRSPAGVGTLPRVPRAAASATAGAHEPADADGDLDDDAGPDGAGAWRDSLTMPRHEPEVQRREREARHVAARIHALLAAGEAEPGDVYVLSRKRDALRPVADALAALHVPFAAPEDFVLIDAPEVRDLVALLDALVSPQHALSLAQALRSPVFGAADDDLVALARAAAAGGHGDWWRALRELPSPSAALRRARECLARWRVAAGQLPPHDLLDLVVAEGEVHERLAAAVPAERRAAALAAVDALLQQALTLDGARYVTPYGFVRALKRRPIKVPAALQPAAVQLLTVHGAKGLEADVVFVLDSDPERNTAETASVLVDWPVESPHPRACAFVYAPSRCPPSLEAARERDQRARAREELNGLYVAMTRARRRLVFSATEPKSPEPPSWWDRVQPLAQPVGGPASHAGGTAAAAPPATLLQLPRPVRPPDGAAASGASQRPAERSRLGAPRAPESPAEASSSGPPAPRPRNARRRDAAAREPDDAASRLGQAVHRVLEWAPQAPDGAALAPLCAAAAKEFHVDASEVERLAERIWRSPACAPFFRGPQLAWSGNEVPVSAAGEPLRIDRLVRLDDLAGSTWWVLDYKLQHAPQALPAYRDQLRRYRDAVRRLQPDDTVRCAFVTGQGDVVEVT